MSRRGKVEITQLETVSTICRAGSQNPVRFLRILAADPVDAVCAQVFQDNGHKLVEKKLSRAE